MSIYLTVSLVVAIIGGLAYLAHPSSHPKIGELGRIAFFCGLLVTLLKGIYGS